MKIKIRPKEIIVIFIKNEEGGICPKVALVLAVEENNLTVAEVNSSNGLASVVYFKGEKGYNYFYPLEGGGIRVDVERIERGIDDSEKITGYFIEDID